MGKVATIEDTSHSPQPQNDEQAQAIGTRMRMLHQDIQSECHNDNNCVKNLPAQSQECQAECHHFYAELQDEEWQNGYIDAVKNIRNEVSRFCRQLTGKPWNRFMGLVHGE